MEPISRIGKYEVGRKLGQGGFGEIYVARDTELDREIALKVLRAEHTQRPQLVQRFLQEARAAARISHPGIVTVFECGQTDAGIVCIAMELLVGETLAARIKREPFELPAVIGLTRQLASALGAAHASGIIHRDLKPQNVFLVPDPFFSQIPADAGGGLRVKVLDFGIAKLSDALGSNVQTHSMEMMGTPLYMSPEQCKSSATVDARSDIYALGCILFELLSGRTPFEGEAGELIAKHQLVPPPPLHELVTGVPPELERLVAAMLAKAPADRPPSMTAIVDALGAVTTAGTLTRLVAPAPEVQFAPTLAPGGTMTDPRAAQLAPTTPFGGGAPLAQVTPATAPSSPAAAPVHRRRDPARRTRMLLIALGSLAIAAGVTIATFVAGDASTKPTAPPTPPTTPVRVEPPAPPEPPKVTDDDDDDDHEDHDDHDDNGSAVASGCQRYVQASVEAGLHGDQAAAARAGIALAKCETSTVDSAAVLGVAKPCAALLEAGTDAEASGDHARALAKLEAAYACKHDAHTLALTVIAACNLGDAEHAKRWWSKLAPAERAKLAAVCARNHVSVE